MDYYKIDKENDIITRFEVFIEKEKLEKLREEIINNCSKIKHFEGQVRGIELIDLFHNKNYLRYRNYNEKYIKEAECNDFYPLDVDWYKIYFQSYDEYIFPDIIKEIDKVLNLVDEHNNKIDSKEVMAILNYEVDNNKEIFPLSLDDIKNNFFNTSFDDPKNIKDSLKKTEDFLTFYELNKNQRPVSEYIEPLKNCIRFIKVNEMSYSEFEKIISFLDINSRPNINFNNEENIVKVLEKVGS